MVPLLVPLLSDAKISIFSVPVENRKKALVGIKMEFNFRKSGTKSGTKKRNPLGLSGFKWCWEESNCRHMDFQSIALPSELQHHRLGMQR